MLYNLKLDFNSLTDIEIYEIVLQNKIHSFPSGFWVNNSTEDAKKVAIHLLRYLLNDKLKLNNDEIKQIISKKFISLYKLHTASKLFGRSAIKYVMDAYPGEFHPWQFKHDNIPYSYWTIEENRINAIKYVLEIELNWSIEDIKQNLCWEMLKERGLLTLHTYYPSLYKLVDAAYPKCMYPWELINSEIPSGTWEDKSNRILAITWLVSKLGNDTKKITRKTFSQYGLSALLENYYCDNPKRALKEVDPTPI